MLGRGGLSMLSQKGAGVAVNPNAPANTTAPAVTPTTGPVGTSYTTTNGTWTNSPTGYTYQWYNNSGSIAGATAASYTAVAGDVGSIYAAVTATNASGSGTAASNAVTVTGTAGGYAQQFNKSRNSMYGPLTFWRF